MRKNPLQPADRVVILLEGEGALWGLVCVPLHDDFVYVELETDHSIKVVARDRVLMSKDFLTMPPEEL